MAPAKKSAAAAKKSVAAVAKKKPVPKKVAKKAAPAKKSAPAAKKAAAAKATKKQAPAPKKSVAVKKAPAAPKSTKKTVIATTAAVAAAPAVAPVVAPAAKKPVFKKAPSAPPVAVAAPSPARKSATPKKPSASSTQVIDNQAIINNFKLLAAYEQRGATSTNKGNVHAKAYNKVAAILEDWVAQGNTITSGASVAHLAGVGTASQTKIDEFIKTGKIQKIDELKNEVGALPQAQIDAILGTGVSAASGPSASGVAAQQKAKSAKKAPVAGAGKSTTGSAKSASAPTAAQEAAIEAAEVALRAKTIPQLKDLARKNGQKVGGTHGELVERLAHQVVLGRVVQCPTCGGGKLQATKTWDGSYRFNCPGFYDDDHYQSCGARFVDGPTMREPWVAV